MTDFLGLLIDIADPFEIIEREIEQGIEDLKGFADDKVVSPIQGAVGWTADTATSAVSDAYTAVYGTIIEGLATMAMGSGPSGNSAVDDYRRGVVDSHSRATFQTEVADPVAAEIVDYTPIGSANCLVGNEPGCSKVVAVAELALFVAPTPPIAKPAAAALRPVATLTSRVARPVLGPLSSVARPVFKPVANGLRSFGQRIRPHPQAGAPSGADDFIDLASPQRRTHILDGDATGGGHRWPGAEDKTPFPQGWADDQVMHHVSDIATDPSLSWNWTKGGPSGYTRAGDPGRASVFGVRDGVCIKVVVEPAGEGIITAHPSPGSC